MNRGGGLMRQVFVLILVVLMVAAVGGTACGSPGGGQGSPAPSLGY
jgi:hypothetical protein